MTDSFPLSFSLPWSLSFASAGAIAVIVIGMIRRPVMPSASKTLIAAAAICFALAAGAPQWRRPAPGHAVICVDLSPSTRSADYRSRTQLLKRVHALLGKTPYRILYFASSMTRDVPFGETLADLPVDRTIFNPPPDASAVVLFSDAQFDLPATAPPTYVVIDPLLESPIDARVSSLQIRGDHAAAEIANSGPPRSVTIDGGSVSSSTAPTGSISINFPIDPSSPQISARLSSGDIWPENDQLSAIPPPPERREKWWIGDSPPPSDWRQMSAAQLPSDASAYLSPAVIVLQNIAASDLSPLQQTRLTQYVRDLGGGLVLLGGDRTFAAGNYNGSELETLSPLASTPPAPTTHWLLLADGSGSMADFQDGVSLWHRATDAIVKLIPHLPPEDLLSVGSFSDALTWWSAGKSVRETAAISLPPPAAGPHGPTNLEDALFNLAHQSEENLPKQLLLLTDAEAEVKDPAGVALALKQKKIHLHLLAIGNGGALPALQIIIGATGGTFVRQLDPTKWANAVEKLMQAGAPKLLGRDPLSVSFLGAFSRLDGFTASLWNRTWTKSSATLLAQGTDDAQTVPAAASWNFGEGHVLAIACAPPASIVQTLIAAIAQPPRDPRYRVNWKAEERFHVTVDAEDGKTFLNDQPLQLEIYADSDTSAATTRQDIPQTAPGRYELDLPALRAAVFAAVKLHGRVLDRTAIAGRYAPEFDAIGNNHANMEQLALHTGGEIIPPRQTWPINFHWPTKSVPLTSVFAILGGLLLSVALIFWKLAT